MTGAIAVSERIHRPIRKANPGVFQSDQEVIDQFVVRNHEFGMVLEVLRGNTESSSCQHILVVGPRGRGKTMLLARVAAEIRTDDELSGRLLPVRFMEESQEISGIADFWLETLFHLARQSKGLDADLARELRETHAALSGRWREKSLSDYARAAVLSAADRLGRKLVLMVENLQMLCESVDRDFGWQLRAVLQSEPQIMLLASATSRFEGLDDVEQPFFELFRIVAVNPLATEDCRRLWRTVSGDSMIGREIRPLEILTGGNPRLLVIVAGFARHRSLRQLMEELVVLIDEHTEYFRGHLEALPRSERRVYIAVIDLWQPSTTGEIADRARMDVRVVSTMLGRLVQRGAVISDPAGGNRKRRYSAAERLYSIYYKLRRERDEAVIVRNLIHFMVVFYSENELSAMYGQLFVEAAESPAIREGIERAMVEVPEFVSSISQALVVIHDETVDRLGANGVPNDLRANAAQALFNEAVTRNQRGDFRGAIERYDAVIRRFSTSDVQELEVQVLLARALVDKGITLFQSGEPRAAIESYDDVLQRIGFDRAPELQIETARALSSKGVAHGQLGMLEAAIAIYDEVIERFGTDQTPAMRVQVVRALVNKGSMQSQLGDFRIAIATYDEAIERFGESDALQLLKPVARSLCNKGAALAALGDNVAAIAAFDDAIDRFGGTEAPELWEEVARALSNLGDVQAQEGNRTAAMTAYDSVIGRFGASDTPELRLSVAMALFGRGVTQAELGQESEALLTCEELERKLGAMTGTARANFAWRVMWVRAAALIAQNRRRAAMGAFRAAYAAFPPGNDAITHWMLGLVRALIAIDAPEYEIIEILSGDSKKSGLLAPLIVALRQRGGETVREPVEVLEVAADVRRRIEAE